MVYPFRSIDRIRLALVSYKALGSNLKVELNQLLQSHDDTVDAAMLVRVGAVLAALETIALHADACNKEPEPVTEPIEVIR